MSRCFPFPPPGYEKKARTDEVDILKKDKEKDRKHKKDKKDKEKKESKEKREKEGRDGKHKEKKDKKEKHRERKKDRDKNKDRDKDKGRDRDKSKIGTADDKGFPRQAEGSDAGQLHEKEIKQNERKGVLFDGRLTKQYIGNNGEMAKGNNHLSGWIKDGNGEADNQLVHKFANTDHRKDERTVRLVAKGGGTWPDSNEKLRDKGLETKKIDGRGMQAEVRPIGNVPVQNHTGILHHRVDGMPKLLGKFLDRNLEATVEGKEVKEKKDEEKEKAKEKTEGGKEKVKDKKADEGEEKVKEKKDGKEKDKEKKDDKREGKRKDREKEKKDKEKEKKGHRKDKDRDKQKKKEEKAKEHSELKTTEQNKLKESNKIGPIDSNFFTQISSNNHENIVGGENLKKRKNIESNGFPHANDNLPNKFPRLSSHSIIENGRTLEPCQISTRNASDRSGVTPIVKVENKECKRNGTIEIQPFSVPLNKTRTLTMPPDLVIEASAKPPHPDTKYLSQVYLVPKVEQWSDFDDQEWLFDNGVSQERKPVGKPSEVGEKPQVWAEVLHIEPDIFALPAAGQAALQIVEKGSNLFIPFLLRAELLFLIELRMRICKWSLHSHHNFDL
ncbi:hypothetical protein RJT34_03674 [Clitoria ternatea]|uniref:Myb-like protein X n=1 Tax=Clitoria ternatea TaxID=43366 RepID=A0AAN9PZZ7_CLITE